MPRCVVFGENRLILGLELQKILQCRVVENIVVEHFVGAGLAIERSDVVRLNAQNASAIVDAFLSLGKTNGGAYSIRAGLAFDDSLRTFSDSMPHG